MSGVGSLGLDSTLRYLMHGTKCWHRVLVHLSSYIDCPVLHQEASLQKICALEKKQAANKHYCCTDTTSAVWPVRTANNAAMQARTLLLYHHCCMYTYRRQCTTPTELSLPCATALPRVGRGLTMSQGRILE